MPCMSLNATLVSFKDSKDNVINQMHAEDARARRK